MNALYEYFNPPLFGVSFHFIAGYEYLMGAIEFLTAVFSYGKETPRVLRFTQRPRINRLSILMQRGAFSDSSLPSTQNRKSNL